ncbi:glycoside hydrolase family 3 C-terminal domain-containing protein [Iamia majanohamensis]|uniref:Exo-alpha-(1->6)-L-arabinopyranosidase n=1 Tax=Iamia majanohamensis TaxID=467976 RepID=A0AAE9Y705_9ACTN|nr:glycoside hydrolase family 3 C-terminal domain-containing protein [Iamia majanohamensis]WCO68075.1 glycoside hydrolase family 3 C-terminal domain-containing protein [Iamia majanohamensis]
MDAPDRSAAALVADLDRATKVRLLSGAGRFTLEGLPQHDLPGVAVADGPHGLRHQPEGGDHLGVGGSVPSTCFPTAATLGSSWDIALVEEVGVALGAEAADLGVAVVLGPGLNIKRHPAGGRCFEYLSEDPLLGGRLAGAMVRGIQSQGVGACLKHFAVNNQESHRLVVDAVVDERTLRELYLTGFEIAVRESAPWTVMCSYNLVNGTYASEHHELLQAILRDEWGFDGLVMTDWGAANDRIAGVRAGLDLEMPGSHGAYDADLLAALDAGVLDEAAVDRCAARVVELLRRARRDRPPCDRDAHHALGRRAAAAGSVLLANDGVLPLAPDLDRIAVVGAFAEHPRFQGAGSSQVTPTRVDRLLDLVRARVEVGTEVTFAAGYDPETGATTAPLVQDALAAADGADAVVVHVGLPAPLESEGFDRTTLDLPAGMVTLIEALAAREAPVVVVLSNGGVVHLPWADRVAAVLEGWLGGQAGAGALVDVLFGDAEPGGRLAESIPVHVAQLPADRSFPGQPRQVVHREGLLVGYRFHDTCGVPARFPFGHGLSYTSFAWTDVALDGEGTDVRVTVRVTNTGDRAGSDVVQVYVRDREAALPRPDKELKGFAKVHLEAGASEVVTVVLDRRSFAVWDVPTHAWLVETGTFDVVVARSSADPVAELVHHVDSADEVTPVPAPAGPVMTDVEVERVLGRPIPAVPPIRPFTRTSTLEEIETTPVGRVISAQVVRVGLREATEEFPDPDAATLEMIRCAVREGPARGLVLMGGGRVSFAALDAALAALNGDWSETGRRVRAAVAQRGR